MHERLVLNNVPDPGAVVAEMVRLTRPGGHVVAAGRGLADLDRPARAPRLAPALPTPPGRSGAATSTSAGDCPPCCALHGLVDVQVLPHLRVFRPGGALPATPYGSSSCTGTRILDGCILTGEQLDAAVARLEAHLTDPGTVTLYATLFQAWGRRPA